MHGFDGLRDGKSETGAKALGADASDQTLSLAERCGSTAMPGNLLFVALRASSR
jgi:hypothetical protein